MSRSKLFVDPTDKYLTRKYTLAGNYVWDTPKHRANLKCCACQGGIVQPFLPLFARVHLSSNNTVR